MFMLGDECSDAASNRRTEGDERLRRGFARSAFRSKSVTRKDRSRSGTTVPECRDAATRPRERSGTDVATRTDGRTKRHADGTSTDGQV